MIFSLVRQSNRILICYKKYNIITLQHFIFVINFMSVRSGVLNEFFCRLLWLHWLGCRHNRYTERNTPEEISLNDAQMTSERSNDSPENYQSDDDLLSEISLVFKTTESSYGQRNKDVGWIRNSLKSRIRIKSINRQVYN